MSIDISILGSENLQQFTELLAVLQESFEMNDFVPPGPEHLKTMLAAPNFIGVVAAVDSKVVGGLTAYMLPQYYSTKPLLYIYDVAVQPQYQRHGIGLKLLAFLKEHCTRNGFEEMYVQAERIDTHALSFYRKALPSREDEVVQFSYKASGN